MYYEIETAFKNFQIPALLSVRRGQKNQLSFLEIIITVHLEVPPEPTDILLLDHHKCCCFHSILCEWNRNTASQALFQQGWDIRDVSGLLTKPCFCEQEETNKTVSAHHCKHTFLCCSDMFYAHLSGPCYNTGSGYELDFYYPLFFLPFSSLLSPPSFKTIPTLRQVPYEFKSLSDPIWPLWVLLCAYAYSGCCHLTQERSCSLQNIVVNLWIYMPLFQ